MGEMVRCAGEVNYFRYYKRLGPIAKLATSYLLTGRCEDPLSFTVNGAYYSEVVFVYLKPRE
jgi:hypothetical protein